MVLGQAIALIASGNASACVVCGIESYKNIDTLHWLESQNRLKSIAQPHGFIPGEAAGAVLVTNLEFAKKYHLPSFAQVLATCHSMEPKPWYTFELSIAEGLTKTFHGVLTADMPIANETWADLNGELWRAEEWALAYIRTGSRHGEPLAIHHPCESWGDVGAASGILLAALSGYELARRRQHGMTAFIWTASDTTPLRSACLLRYLEEVKR